MNASRRSAHSVPRGRRLQPAATASRALAAPVLPDNAQELQAIAARCRQIVSQRAMLSAGAAVVPLPGLDLMVDVGVLTRLLREINEAFGLTPAQIEALSAKRQFTVYKAINTLGATAVGRLITREVVTLAAKSVLRRVAAKTALRYVPLAGQAMAAGVSFAAIKALGDRHIDDCIRVASRAIDVN